LNAEFAVDDTVAMRAAKLLYYIVKDRPFLEGNKRIGALLFIVYLTQNDFSLTKNNETKISDRALTALVLLIAESESSEKELILKLITKLLDD
jgi:prophage maintenance system killer protein